MIERSTVGSLLRCTQSFCQQICDKDTLQYGIAFSSPRFPLLSEANQFREVTVESREQILAAMDEGLQWFAARNLSCQIVAPAIGQSVADFELLLTPHGFTSRHFTALRLTRWTDLPAPANVRVLPARAMRAVTAESYLQDTEIPPIQRASAAEAFAERLDDAALDAFVALVEGKVAGRCALYQVGDLARVMDLVVLGPFHEMDVEAALLTQVDANRADRLAWLVKAGFEEDGDIIEFLRGDTAPSGDVR